MIARLAVLLLTLAFLTLSADFSFGQTLWTAGVGDWFDADNWTLGAPGAATDAQVNNGGTALILAPGAAANSVALGAAPLTSGSLDVQGGQAQFASVLAVGAFGHGALNIAAGGSVSNFHGRIGRELGGTGVVTVTGPGSLWQNNGDLTVGGATGGVGTLTIANQATVHVQNQLSINSASAVNLNGGKLRFNTLAGLGQLNFGSGTIQLAGNRAVGSDPTITALFGAPVVQINSGKGLEIEGSATVSRSVRVDGGAFNPDILYLGGVANGNLEITNGGKVETSYVGVSGSSPISGTISVSGSDSMLKCFDQMSVGAVSLGTVNINPGGTVFVENHLIVGTGVYPEAKGIINILGGTLRLDTFTRNANGVFSFHSGTIQLEGDRTVGADSAITEFFGATPTIESGKELTVEQTATIASGLTINGGTFRAESVVVNGPLHFGGGLLELTGGTITGLSSLAVPTNGEFRASGVQGLRVAGAPGSTITATGNLTLGNASAVNGFGTQGTLQVGANAVTLLDANDVVFDSLSLVTLGDGVASGVIDAANGLTLDSGGNISGFGAVNTPNNVAKPLINNGHITGDSLAEPMTLAGYVKGVGSFDNVQFTGAFSPGFSPAKVNLGSVRYDGALEIEIGGLTPGVGYDQLNHILGAGAAQLGGTLEVSLAGGFMPSLGAEFEIITALGGIQNMFDNALLPDLAGGLGWNLVYGADSVLLKVVSGGYTADFDHDGDVDGDDLTRWRNNFGTGATHTQGDADGDLDSDGADFLIWQRQLGSVGPAAPVVGSAPEPGTLPLVAMSVFGLAVRARQRQRRDLLA